MMSLHPLLVLVSTRRSEGYRLVNMPAMQLRYLTVIIISSSAWINKLVDLWGSARRSAMMTTMMIRRRRKKKEADESGLTM